MKYDLNRNLVNSFGSSKYKHKLLTDEMKKALVKEALKIGSIQELFDKLEHNYREIKLSEAMNKPDAFKVIKYEVGANDEPVPVYRWMKEPIIIDDNLTIEQEALNFVYWLNPKKVKEYI